MSIIKKKLLSIIIPVYNVEEYLKECVDSIVQQIENYEKNIEIILINDGSTDNSGCICDEYKRKYKFVKTFHKQNEGLSETRNYGLIKSTGKYVWFVDSDDYICSSSIKNILIELKSLDIDVLLGDANIVDVNGKFIKTIEHKGLEHKNIYTGLDCIKNQLEKNKKYVVTVWSGIYNREFLIKNNLFFEKDLLHEDELWKPIMISKASSLIYIENKIYNYRIRPNSIMRQNEKKLLKHVKSIIYILNYLYFYIENNINDKYVCRLIKNDISGRFLYSIVYWKFYKFPELYKEVDAKKIFLNSFTLKNKVRSFVLLINRNFYSKIMNVIKRVL